MGRGYGGPIALEILQRDIRFQYGNYDASPYTDALQSNPGEFDLGWYDMQHLPLGRQMLGKFVQAAELLDRIEIGVAESRGEKSDILPWYRRFAKPASIAAAVGLALLSGCSASDQSVQDDGTAFLQQPAAHYNIALFSNGKYHQVNGLAHGLSKLKNDKNSHALFIGDFTEDQFALYKGVIDRFTAINPDALRPTELIFVKVPISSNTPVALPNYANSLWQLRQMLQELLTQVNSEKIYDIVERGSDGLRRDLIAIPASSQDLRSLTERIQKAFRERGNDGYDIILVTESTDDGNAEVSKEICEIIISDMDAFDPFIEQIKRNELDDFRLGLDGFVYVNGNRKQPEEWVKAEMKGLEQLITLYEQLSPDGRKSVALLLEKEKPRGASERYKQAFSALEHLGVQKTREAYESILKEVVLEWKLRNLLAHGIADIVAKNFYYYANRGALETWEGFISDYHQMIHHLQKIYSLDPDPKKRLELLEHIDHLLGELPRLKDGFERYKLSGLMEQALRSMGREKGEKK